MDLEKAKEQIRESLPEEYREAGVFLEYDQIRGNIFCQLMNTDRNRQWLEDIPHTQTGDMAEVYRIQMTAGGRVVGSVLINEDIMEGYGLNLSSLHELALENTGKIFPAKILPLDDVIRKQLAEHIMEENDIGEDEAESLMRETIPEYSAKVLCVTNEWAMNGAACAVMPDVQKEIAELVGGDYYVIPSSVHEMLVFPADMGMEPHEMEEMLRTANRDVVRDDEVLSDSVYFYDAKEQKFMLAENMGKMREKEHSEKEPEKDRGERIPADIPSGAVVMAEKGNKYTPGGKREPEEMKKRGGKTR